jgi:hypothetical protein
MFLFLIVPNRDIPMRCTILLSLTLLSITLAVADIEANDTEPNTDWQDAVPLPKDRTVAGTQSDVDWYLFNATIGDRILIDLTFTHAEGDIDMELRSGPSSLAPMPNVTAWYLRR